MRLDIEPQLVGRVPVRPVLLTSIVVRDLSELNSEGSWPWNELDPISSVWMFGGICAGRFPT